MPEDFKSAIMDAAAQSIFQDYPFIVKIKKNKPLKLNTRYPLPLTLPMSSDEEQITERTGFHDIPDFGTVWIPWRTTYITGISSRTGEKYLLFNTKAPTIPARIVDEENNILKYVVITGTGKPIYADNPSLLPSQDILTFTTSYQRNTSNQIFKKGSFLGKGSFGTVKQASELSFFFHNKPPHDICLKTLRIKNDRDRVRTEKEFTVLEDLGYTAGKLSYRGPLTHTKAVIPLKNLGKSLITHINAPLDTKLSYSIELLLAVDRLHKGTTSKNQRPLAHCDIKPNNVLVDDRGVLHLIDFGLTTEHVNETIRRGTILYLPINLNLKTIVQINYTVLEQDKIASLRTIYHPLQRSKKASDLYLSLLNQDEFDSLPLPLQTLLDTQTITPCLNSDQTEKMIASVLAYYQVTQHLTQDDIDKIQQNEDIQDCILQKREESTPYLKENIRTFIEIIKYLKQQIERLEKNPGFFSSKNETKKKLKDFREQLNCAQQALQDIALGTFVKPQLLKSLIEQIETTAAISRGPFDKTKSALTWVGLFKQPPPQSQTTSLPKRIDSDLRRAMLEI